MDQDETWLAGTPQPWHGDPALPPQRGTTPQFSAHICCRQMAGWIKMQLGMEVGLGPGDFLLDGDPSPPPKKGAEPPLFGPCLLWPNGWMDQDGTWHGCRPRSRLRCARCGLSSPPPKKRGQSPQLPAIVAKQLYASGYHLVWRYASALATLC